MATLYGNSANLATAQVGNGQTTNVGYRGAPDSGSNQNPALLRVTAATGATPTCTYQIEGSADSIDWFPIDYADVASSAVNAIVLGATGVSAYNNNANGVNVVIAGGTVTAVAINGTTVGPVAGTFYVPGGGNINVTYSVTPTTFTTTATPVAEAWGRGTFTLTAAGPRRFILRSGIPWTFVRVTMSANTNVTNTIDVFFFKG